MSIPFRGRAAVPDPQPVPGLLAHADQLTARINTAVDGIDRALATCRRRTAGPHEQQLVDALLDARHTLVGRPVVEEVAG